MKTKVIDPQSLTNLEMANVAIEVLDLLDGLCIGAVAEVLNVAEGLAKTYTPLDIRSAWFREAVGGLAEITD